jgi:hypothetical protein
LCYRLPNRGIDWADPTGGRAVVIFRYRLAGVIFFIRIGCNPLKSPDSEK